MQTQDATSANVLALAQVFATLAQALAGPPTERTASSVATLASALGVACPQGVPLPALERDYADLFAVPNPRYVAPYESVYRDGGDLPPVAAGTGTPAKRGLLMGPSTLAVQRAQLEAGLQPRRDLPDHVANELWFMAHLCRKEAEAKDGERAEWISRRERFADAHLRQWLAELTANVHRHERCGVYGAALDVARSVIDLE